MEEVTAGIGMMGRQPTEHSERSGWGRFPSRKAIKGPEPERLDSAKAPRAGHCGWHAVRREETEVRGLEFIPSAVGSHQRP